MTPNEPRVYLPDQPLPEAVQGAPVLLASSGGGDSLGALVMLHHWLAAGKIPALSVVSIDHQIHPESRRWSEQACAQAAALGVAASIVTVALPGVDAQGHRSLESRARQARYQALAQSLAAVPGAILVTAHHREDQAETVLLALLRGSGVAGLSAMPALTPFAGRWHWRPFLAVPRATLRSLAADFPVPIVDDPSNLDTNQDRNFLRHAVLPLLSTRWPSATTQLAQTALVAAQERQALDELAARVTTDLSSSVLPLAPLLQISPGAQASVLRAWVAAQGALMPPRARLQEFLRQIQAASQDRQPVLAWGKWRIVRDRQVLHWLCAASLPLGQPAPSNWGNPRQEPFLWQAAQWRLQSVSDSHTVGIAEHWLDASWCVRPWRASDRLRVSAGARRSIKTLFQAMAVPVHARRAYGLIEIDGEPAWVPGLAMDMKFRAEPGQGWHLLDTVGMNDATGNSR